MTKVRLLFQIQKKVLIALALYSCFGNIFLAAQGQSKSEFKKEDKSTLSTRLPAAASKAARLEGKVEASSNLERLERPVQLQEQLQRAVEVLPKSAYGSSYQLPAQAINADTASGALENILGADSFELPYARQEARPGWPLGLRDLKLKANACLPCLEKQRRHDGRRRHHRGPGFSFAGWPGLTSNWDAGWGLPHNRVDGRLNSKNTQANIMDSDFDKIPSAVNITPVLPGLINTQRTRARLDTNPDFNSPIEQSISWDPWYQNVANELLRIWNSISSEPGQAELRITVDKGRKVNAEIVNTTNFNKSFKKGLLKAVNELSGSSVLDFPRLSQRRSVIFQSRFDAGTKTQPGAFSTKSNDIERLHLFR